MIIAIVTAIFAGLYGFTIWKFLDHIRHLELVAKAKNLDEAVYGIRKPDKDAPIKPVEEEPTLAEVFADQSPDQIRSSFLPQ